MDVPAALYSAPCLLSQPRLRAITGVSKLLTGGWSQWYTGAW